MRAAVVTELSDSTEAGIARVAVVDTHPPPEPPGHDEVLVEVRAAALNFPDLLHLTGLYQIRPPLPYVPGCEVAGVVSAVGPGVTSCRVGDRVECRTWLPEMNRFDVRGEDSFPGLGAMASLCKTHAKEIRPIPPGLGFEEAAGVYLGYATAWNSMINRGSLTSEDTLLITGAAGGMGLAALDVAKNVIGCKQVICAAGSDAKCQRLLELGADNVVNYSDEPRYARAVKAMTGGEGVSAVFDVVGGEVLAECVRACKSHGKLLLIGFTAGQANMINANYVLVKALSIIGTGSWSEFEREEAGRQITAFAAQGLIRPQVSHSFPLTTEGVQSALLVMHNREAVGKVVVCPRPLAAAGGEPAAPKL
jgi:NADPH2:quinone reductase